MSEKKAILVVGAGDATGGAIARRFARDGYIACVTRRHADKLAPLLARIEADGGKTRDLAPQGIPVAQIIVDAAIDTAFIRENFPERYALKEREGIVDPEAIAESYWQLHITTR